MIAIIDYRAGNLTSVRLAMDAVGADAEITSDPERIRAAERVVFPGVGAAGAAMGHLGELALAGVIREVVDRGTPFLGICLGTQIILEHSEENDGVDTLGLVKGRVRLFRPADPHVKVPQMGWNTVHQVRPHPVFEGIADNSEFYFVHSYHPEPDLPECILGETEYADVTFASVLGRGNLVATQFHPEKSGRVGLKLLANFCAWNGEV
ncbi:MAG: imidazole glycerol phosphate synthase subunit HisH [Lentisphaerae bacterium]|nr:imidazole glycerol phosphate synthase subunit HisH [Lentisphaerota bacterium]